MARKKTSVEQSKEDQKDAQVGNLLDAAFGDLGGLQKPVEEQPEISTESEDEVEKDAETPASVEASPEAPLSEPASIANEDTVADEVEDEDAAPQSVPSLSLIHISEPTRPY